MIRFVIETDIARPPASVFEYVTDPGKLATWQTSTVSAVPETPGPIGLGSRLRFAVLGEPSGMLRVAAAVMRPVLRRRFAGYCSNLKRILENGSR